MSDDTIIAVLSEGEYIPLPYPSSYKVIDQAIYSQAERNVEFKHVCDLGAIKRQITLSWNFITPEEFKQICDLTAPIKGGSSSSDRVYINVKFYDPQRDSIQYGDFYRDSSFDYSVVGVWGERPQGVKVSMTLTEQ